MNKAELKQWFFDAQPNMAVFWATVSEHLLGNTDFKDFLESNNITSQTDYMRKIQEGEVPEQTALGFLQDVADLHDINNETVFQDFDGGCLSISPSLYRRRYVWLNGQWYTSCEVRGVMTFETAAQEGGHYGLAPEMVIKQFWRLEGV